MKKAEYAERADEATVTLTDATEQDLNFSGGVGYFDLESLVVQIAVGAPPVFVTVRDKRGGLPRWVVAFSAGDRLAQSFSFDHRLESRSKGSRWTVQASAAGLTIVIAAQAREKS